MKRLLYITFIITSLTGFSQEKKGTCSSLIQLYHNNANDSIPDDHFATSGFTFDHAAYSGSWQVDTTTWIDSLIYEVTIPFGDSLQYIAYWHADGMCYSVDTGMVNHVVTVLEGTAFPIIYTGDFTSLSYDLSQEGIIHDPCLFKIQRMDIPHKQYFIRVKFLDLLLPETPLDLPEVTNDISLWLSGENTLSVKADEDAVWEINLYSLSGQLIYHTTIEGENSIDVSTLSKGYFIACVTDQSGIEKSLKFVR